MGGRSFQSLTRYFWLPKLLSRPHLGGHIQAMPGELVGMPGAGILSLCNVVAYIQGYSNGPLTVMRLCWTMSLRGSAFEPSAPAGRHQECADALLAIMRTSCPAMTAGLIQPEGPGASHAPAVGGW